MYGGMELLQIENAHSAMPYGLQEFVFSEERSELVKEELGMRKSDC